MKKKRLLTSVIIFLVLLNPISLGLYINLYGIIRKEWLWFSYKNDFYEYVYNSDKNDFFDDPTLCCMRGALEDIECRINDSLKVDSVLVELLRFRNKYGNIQCNDLYGATITHIICTRRYHLLPYVQELRDSFASYPIDMEFYTKNSDGMFITNKNIKKEIEIDIEYIQEKLKK